MTRKIALITGASRGLGKSTALHLAAAGIDVIGTYHSNRDAADQTASEIQAKGGKAVMLPLDAGDSAAFPAFVQAVTQALKTRFGREQFDFLVNNAGMGIHASFAETTEAQFDQLFQVHLKGPYFLTQALLPHIADGGRIVNVSSGLTRFALPGYAAYASMKGAVEVMTRYMAKELGARDIRVNTLAPGAIETDFGGGAVRDDAEINQFVASVTALGRVGMPEDIGGAVATLLAPESGWINAQRIEASGGMFV